MKQKNDPMRMEARRPILSQTLDAAKAAKNAVIFRHATVIPTNHKYQIGFSVREE